ncbi:uncharacterized protein [Arachis hypogaea]|uniref:uncharacterized protein n=1 Tax=Arachis hypogaea TaxID=3818 RepID=UPI003B21D489|nr:Ulp1 protease family, carboxy-terminal domain protein [Arachis hypogaea]
MEASHSYVCKANIITSKEAFSLKSNLKPLQILSSFFCCLLLLFSYLGKRCHKYPQSRDSGLWVLQWLSMREKFNPTVSGILNEQYIRTSVVVDLLLGMFNDHKYEFQKKSNEFWATL